MRTLYIKLSAIKSWQASVILLVCGLITYSSGLISPFQGDDLLQIVHNPAVHSLKNIRLFFESGTFYSLNTSKEFTGSYYRPLMTTTFSALYTVFGPHPFYFHLLQLLLCISSSILLYLFFRYSFTPLLALFLSLVFLLNPIDSNVVYSIPCMQDALFFFFGILALYILIHYQSIRSLSVVVLCLLLSLFSKETAIVFIGISILFLFWWDRKRLLPFVGMVFLPLVGYLALRIHAIGFFGSPAEAPILRISLAGRLFTAPSVFLFYIDKALLPWKLATGYFWVSPTFSIGRFLLPLVADMAIIGLFVYAGFVLRSRSTKAMLFSYSFFGIWTLLGILTLIQIIPLDMTASEAWFYVCMAGVLGLLGILFNAFKPKVDLQILFVICIIIVGVYGVRTAMRGFDYHNPETLAYKNIAASNDDYTAYDQVATYLMIANQYNQAVPYLKKSISILPAGINYGTLGDIYLQQNNYQLAEATFKSGLHYGGSEYVNYEGLAKLSLVIGQPAANWQLLSSALRAYPHDPNLWLYMALFEDRYGQNSQAVIAIDNADKYGNVPAQVYQDINENIPFKIYLSGNQSIII